MVHHLGCRLVCRWGLGPYAQIKKKLISEGKLDKHGRPNENTPKEYLRSLPDVEKGGAAAAAPASATKTPAKEAAITSPSKSGENGATAEKKKKEKKEKKRDRSPAQVGSAVQFLTTLCSVRLSGVSNATC